MVVFIDGIPAKREYRHFKVKLSLGSDDAGAMREVLQRRFRRVVEEGNPGIEPDLVIIDGGLPQLSAGLLASSDAGIAHLELTALAKREELLYRPNLQEPVRLPPRSEALYLVQRIRDEAHRFAITFHRSQRSKGMVADELSAISGLGQSRRDRLVQHFGTMAAIRGASLDELSALSWLPRKVAHNLYDHFHGVQATQLRKD
jgi:excinuclease ABC subunit C